MIRFPISIILVLILGFIACQKEPKVVEKAPISAESVAEIAEMNQALGWKIFNQEQINKPGENILISPFSIQTALNMATNGAKGNTLQEILELMDRPDYPISDLNRLHNDLTTLLCQQSGHPTLTVANRFFYDKNRATIKSPFLDAISSYGCGSENLDFDGEQAAVDHINAWVKTSTLGKIDKILNNISVLDVAFLISALHFKADWAIGFSSELTHLHPFTKADGAIKQVEFVNADRVFSFSQTAKYNLVDIPFKDSTFSLSFIQAAEGNAETNWHSTVNPETFKSLFANIQSERAIVYFPKLKLSYENDLIKSLELLGVNDAFSPDAADFTDLGTALSNIFIRQLKHKVVLEVDEKGAEGAAVTSIGFGIDSLPPSFLFNHPFVLVLRHIPTNTMIFTGYVADPSI
ncbi:MAG: serpin family protein [Saprospiraceae bacterium]|nr:serpin family protein [Saprospiraceae bacterium]